MNRVGIFLLGGLAPTVARQRRFRGRGWLFAYVGQVSIHKCLKREPKLLVTYNSGQTCLFAHTSSSAILLFEPDLGFISCRSKRAKPASTPCLGCDLRTLILLRLLSGQQRNFCALPLMVLMSWPNESDHVPPAFGATPLSAGLAKEASVHRCRVDVNFVDSFSRYLKDTGHR
jgi:hypothetical protein